MFSRFSRTPACDGQTDGQRHNDSINCACVASRGKKLKKIGHQKPIELDNFRTTLTSAFDFRHGVSYQCSIVTVALKFTGFE